MSQNVVEDTVGSIFFIHISYVSDHQEHLTCLVSGENKLTMLSARKTALPALAFEKCTVWVILSCRYEVLCSGLLPTKLYPRKSGSIQSRNRNLYFLYCSNPPQTPQTHLSWNSDCTPEHKIRLWYWTVKSNYHYITLKTSDSAINCTCCTYWVWAV